MVNRILKTLSKNLGFKILAVLFAFTLWVTVYNLDDPTKTKSLTVNVTVTNKEVLEELGKYYEIQDGMNKVSFSVTAPRSILDKLDESDIHAGDKTPSWDGNIIYFADGKGKGKVTGYFKEEKSHPFFTFLRPLYLRL